MHKVSACTLEGKNLAYIAFTTIFNTSPSVALLPTMTSAASRGHVVRCNSVAHKSPVFRTVWEATPVRELGAAFSSYGLKGRIYGVWVEIRLILSWSIRGRRIRKSVKYLTQEIHQIFSRAAAVFVGSVDAGVIASTLIDELRVHVDGDITPALSSIDDASKGVVWSKPSVNRTRIPTVIDTGTGVNTIPVCDLVSKSADGVVVDLINTTNEAVAVRNRWISLAYVIGSDSDYSWSRWSHRFADGKIRTVANFVHRRCNEAWIKSDGNGQRIEDLEHGENYLGGRSGGC
jgi:hypothetical protein